MDPTDPSGEGVRLGWGEWLRCLPRPEEERREEEDLLEEFDFLEERTESVERPRLLVTGFVVFGVFLFFLLPMISISMVLGLEERLLLELRWLLAWLMLLGEW